MRGSFLLLLLLTACQYRFQETGGAEAARTIHVPYVEGDYEGKLTDALIYQLAASGAFQPVETGASLLLKVKILSNSSQKIDFRHHRDDTTGRLRKRLMPTENREMVIAEVSLIDPLTGSLLLGPEQASAFAEYDYVDPDSIRELTFTDSSGNTRVVLNYSLGQLDSVEGAHDDAKTPLFRQLAQKIVDGILLLDP